MKTYNNIINIFKSFAKRHKQVNSFFLGRDFDLENASKIAYPCLQVYPLTARMPQNEGYFQIVTLSFNIKIVDLLLNDNTNEDDINSDTLQIAQDLVNEINANQYFIDNNIQIDGDIQFDVLNNYEDSNSNGWEFQIDLKYLNNSTCDLPIEPLEPVVTYTYIQFEDEFEFEFEDDIKFEFQN